MAPDPHHLKLGKGVAFVKSQLRRLPQGDDVWEADFMWALNPLAPRGTAWQGLVVHRDGWIIADRMLEQPPNVNDMATLLADAMRRPYVEHSRRPHTIRLRKRHQWQELHPHLIQLGIKVIAAPGLAKWDQAFEEMQREVAKHRPDLPSSAVEAEYPAIARFVQGHGWIEIGDHEREGFVVRALEHGGVVFESRKPKTLDEAMATLERRVGRFLKDNG
jgi:Domain of unknown function (DUF6930)